MNVQNMKSKMGNPSPNQFEIFGDNGEKVFQSYGTIIARKQNGKVTLDRQWDCSKTTGFYRNQFLGEDKATTERKIKSGEYTVTDLN